MTLGALIVLAVLVAAGIYVPRTSWTHAKSPDAGTTSAAPGATQTPSDQSLANQNPANPSSEMAAPGSAAASPATDPSAATMSPNSTSSNSLSQPAAPAASAPSADSSNAMQPSQMPPAAAAMAKSNSVHAHAKKLMAQDSGLPGEAAGATQSGGAAAAAADNSAQLDEMEKAVDQLSNRAAAVNSSLDRLQQQQAASGYGLRADMVERQASLKSNLYKAEEALQHKDLARTKKYLDLAEGDAGVLERFLGH